MQAKAKKDLIIKGKKAKLKGSSGVTAKGKQLAVKGDKVIGIDTHDLLQPTPNGPVLLPSMPHPYIGSLSSKLSKNVKINNKNAATKGSKSKAKPPHMPIPPTTTFKKPPNNQGVISSGTEKSVKINDKEAAVLMSGVKTCNDPSPKESTKVFSVGFPMAAVLAKMRKDFDKKQKKEAKKNKNNNPDSRGSYNDD